MVKFKIEKNNIRVRGHSGYGRITLVGKNKFSNLTINQAAPIIGDAVINRADKLLRKEDLDFRNFGIEVEIIFKTYKREDGTENNT